jgi:hypothetical protein
MVVRTKDQAKAEFAKNLNAALSAQGAPDRGRPEWLRRRLAPGLEVSRETCRKWLAGIDIPDQAHMSVLIDRFRLNEQQLRTGSWSPPPGHDKDLDRLNALWAHLPPMIKAAIMGMIKAVEDDQPRGRKTE